jgi:predicted MFS family arabinose efflux permease
VRIYSQPYKRYVTVVLLIVYIFNQTDRAIFGFLMQSIKADLKLSDTQLGFLAGPALAIFYATLGIPIARFADRRNRVNVIAIAIALWSAIVVCSAAVGKFWHFALARVGVGVGEAGFSAIAQSLITDYHAPHERTRALSVFMLAIPLGSVVSSLTAGWINQGYGWRVAFVAAGLPGLILAPLVKWTVREPAQGVGPLATAQQAPSTIRSLVALIWQRPALRHLAIAQGLANIVVACALTWIPAFFIRVHGMQSAELGTWLAIVGGIGGSAGIWLGGYLTTRFGGGDEAKKMQLTSFATALAAPMLIIVLWVPAKHLAMTALLPCEVVLFFFYGPTFALVQALSAANVRATMASAFILIQVLAGGVIGVQLLGVLSDFLTALTGSGAVALRWGMTLISLLAVWSAGHFWRSGQLIGRHDRSEGAAKS